jgi:hypothetical protein
MGEVRKAIEAGLIIDHHLSRFKEAAGIIDAVGGRVRFFCEAPSKQGFGSYVTYGSVRRWFPLALRRDVEWLARRPWVAYSLKSAMVLPFFPETTVRLTEPSTNEPGRYPSHTLRTANMAGQATQEGGPAV